MACPYAANIKGAVAYCKILNKKVSTLKYPCKGNYKRCPVYIRRPIEIKPVQKIQEEVKPEESIEKPVIEEKPKVTPVVQKPVAQPTPSEVKTVNRNIKWKPGKAICDTLLLTLLVTVSETIGIVKGSYRDLEEKLLEVGTNGSFVFIVGNIDAFKVKFTYSSKLVFSLMAERDGNQLCGEDALKEIEPLEKRRFDLVLYSVSWSSLGEWGSMLRKDLDKLLSS